MAVSDESEKIKAKVENWIEKGRKRLQQLHRLFDLSVRRRGDHQL